MMERRENIPPSQPPTATKIESFTCPEAQPASRKKKNKNKRRFSDEQVKLLESMFDTETKLEPRKKVQLARELGLQPRQVAIWFQNRRARWKSKHVEKEYTLLKANYDNLMSRFESLKKEKQSLLIQLQRLNDLLGQPYDSSKGKKHLVGNITDGSSENGDNNCEYETNPGRLDEEFDRRFFMEFDKDNRRNIGNSELEEGKGLQNKQIYCSLASPEKWGRVESSGPVDQSCSDSHWWDFWT